MNWVVEARVFTDGSKIVIRIKEGKGNDKEGYKRIGNCHVWTDIFDGRQQACNFARQYT